MAELSLWLDSYDDIYSDFDARTLLKRRVSEDFIHELEMAYKRKEENTDLLLLQVPASLSNGTDEKLITERLKSYFNREYDLGLQILKRNTKRNIFFFCISILIMSLNIIISLCAVNTRDVLSQVRILLEPAGWFFFWNSLEYFFYRRQAEVYKTRFWNTVAGWKILFKSY